MKDRFDKYLEDRQKYFREVLPLGRRDFIKAAGVAAAAAVAGGKLLPPFQPVDVVTPTPREVLPLRLRLRQPLREELNERFVRAILKAVDDVNAMSPA
jgi:hypothetical protein